jgi:predicted AlkP superfamily pyrophosphatase or phosphodiesterase
VADFVLMTMMLPAISPRALNLKDVFLSAEASIFGESNAMNLSKVESVIVVMIDGLGYENVLSARPGFMRSSLSDLDFAHCGFPSTTASSIASFATGTDASSHGLIGYSVFDRSLGETVNLLSGLDRFSILDYFKASPLSEKSRAPVHAVTLATYENSGFTRATMHRATHHFDNEIADRFNTALRLTRDEPGCLVYVYVPELDKQAHRSGVDSSHWHELFDTVQREVQMLAAKVASNVGLLVTADHGVVDVTQANHVYLDDMAYLDDQLVGVSGDPRSPYLYLKDSDTLPEISSFLSESFGESAAVVTPAELVELHYWSASILEDRDVLPDLVILALENIAIYHRGFAKPASLRVIGQHGSITEQETKVPTLRLGAYSSSLLVP